jgi:hypothetical protein
VKKWLRDEISWDQLNDWFRFIDLEPIGEEREDLRIGALATVIRNSNVIKSEHLTTPYRYIVGTNDQKQTLLYLKPKEIESGSKSIDEDSITSSLHSLKSALRTMKG